MPDEDGPGGLGSRETEEDPHSRDDVVQFGNDDTENPEILEPCILMYKVRTSSHQQQPCDFGGRRPSANGALGFVVEKALAAESGVPMMFEGVGRRRDRQGRAADLPQTGQVMRHPESRLRMTVSPRSEAHFSQC